MSILVSGAMSAAAALWGLVLVMLPDSVGTRLLGPTWYAAATVVVPYVLLTIGLTASAGPQSGLRALAAARRGLRARLVASPLLRPGAPRPPAQVFTKVPSRSWPRSRQPLAFSSPSHCQKRAPGSGTW